MAKKDSPMVAPIKYKPRLYLELGSAGLVRELSVGDRVNLVVRGKCVGLSTRQDERGKSSGCVDLEDFVVKLAPKSVWDDLDEDDE